MISVGTRMSSRAYRVRFEETTLSFQIPAARLLENAVQHLIDAAALLRSCVAVVLYRRPEDRFEKSHSSDLGCGPEKNVRRGDRVQHGLEKLRRCGGDGAFWRVRQRHDQQQRGASLGMPQTKLHGGRGAGGNADHGDAVELQRIEQSQMRVGLRFCRGIARKRRAEVTETRRRDDTEVVADEGASEIEALIEASASSVDEKDGRAVSRFREFNRSVSGADDLPLDRNSASSTSLRYAAYASADAPVAMAVAVVRNLEVVDLTEYLLSQRSARERASTATGALRESTSPA